MFNLTPKSCGCYIDLCRQRTTVCSCVLSRGGGGRVTSVLIEAFGAPGLR